MADQVELDRQRDESRRLADEAKLELEAKQAEHVVARTRHSEAVARATEAVEKAELARKAAELLRARLDPKPPEDLVPGLVDESESGESPPSLRPLEERRREHEQEQAALKKALEDAEATASGLEEEASRAGTALEEERRRHDEARGVRDSSRKRYAQFEEQAICAAEAAAHGSKKVLRWLAWDGVPALAGACNGHYPETAASREIAEARTKLAAVTRKVALAPVSSAQVDTVSGTLLLATTVSVRIKECDAEVVPIRDRWVVQVALKRVHRIRSLLLRIEKQTGEVVYEERLDAARIDRLPGTRDVAAGHPEPDLVTRIEAANTHAQPEPDPLKVRVWVSADANAFDSVAAGGDLSGLDAYGRTVHDQSMRPDGEGKPGKAWLAMAARHAEKKGEIADLQGRNRFRVRRVRVLRVAQLKLSSKHATARDGRTDDQKVDEVFACLDEANTRFGAARPGELRALIAPEWNFEKVVAPGREGQDVNLYDPTELGELTDKLRQKSGTAASARDWLVVPGSVLWGVPSATYGVWAAFNTQPVFHNGAEVCRYTKRQWGGDVVDDRSLELDLPFLERDNVGNEKRRSKLNSGRVPRLLAMDLCDVGAAMELQKSEDAPVVTIVRDQRWSIVYDANKFFSVTKDGKSMRTGLGIVYTPFYTPDECRTLFGPTFDRDMYLSLDVNRNFFTFPGTAVKCALEICADHRGAQAIRTTRPNDIHEADTVAGAGVDLHFIISCGTPLVEWKIVARTGGFCFHCDGETGGTAGRFVRGRNQPISAVRQAQLTAEAARTRTSAMSRNPRTGRDRLRYVENVVPAVNPGSAPAPTTICAALASQPLVTAGGVTVDLYTNLLVER